MKETDPILFANLLLRYCKDDLPEDQKKEVEEFISENPRIQQLAEEIRDQAKVNKEIALISSFDVEAALKNIRKPHEKRFMTVMKVASVIVFFLVITFVYYLNTKKTDKQPDTIEAMEIGNGETILRLSSGEVVSMDTLAHSMGQNIIMDNKNGVLQLQSRTGTDQGIDTVLHMIEVPYKGTYKLILQDGTKVSLNSGSSLQFPSVFASDERKVVLSGEAFFDVKPDGKSKFTVETGRMQVHVSGTSFNIKAYTDEAFIQTTLVNGNIHVTGNNGVSREVSPGQQLSFHRQTQNMEVKNVDTELYSAWKDGFFYFKDTPLEDIMKRIERWYNLKVSYTDPQIRNTLYSGKMQMYDSVVDILRKFEKSGGLQFDIKENTIVISPK